MDLSTNHPIGDWVRASFPNETIAFCINGLIAAVSILTVCFTTVPLLIWMERKVSAHIQARLGPMRVGWHGILQSVADIIKLIHKEVMMPRGADGFVFFLAPMLPITASLIIMTVIPFDHHLQVTDLNIGVLFVIAISGLGTLGVLTAGWSSNNKFSLLGAMRSGAQMISYEISIAFSMLFIVLISGTASLREIVLTQQGTVFDWWIFKLPLLGFVAFILFLVSSTAELNRGPFDIAEAEQEITAGFHTEYSGMTFAFFFLAEYINMIIAAAMGTTLFLGGFLAPQIGIAAFDKLLAAAPGFVWFGLKTLLIIFVYMLFRWTFPRPRVDQLMGLEWKFLLPANLFVLVLGGIFVSLGWILQ